MLVVRSNKFACTIGKVVPTCEGQIPDVPYGTALLASHACLTQCLRFVEQNNGADSSSRCRPAAVVLSVRESKSKIMISISTVLSWGNNNE